MTVVDDFAADYFVVNRISEPRRADVRRILALLSAFAGRPIEEVDADDLANYLASLVAGGMHVNTVRRYNHAIKPFFRWAFHRRIVTADQWLRIQDVKNPRGASGSQKPRPYKRAEVKEFWRLLDERWPLVPDKRLKRWRNGTCQYKRVWTHAMNLQTSAVVSLALFAGLRHNEIFTISMDDLHPDNDYLVVHGKTVIHEVPKVREVPYTEEGREIVAAWLEFRAWMKPKHNHPWLVVNANASMHPGRGVFRSLPNDQIKDGGFDALVQYPGAYELHRFRHTFATEQLRAGTDLEVVSRMLGHANLQQTLVYAEIVKEDLQRAARRSERTFIRAVGRAA
jgi:site-specific recombinase XerD